jgi:hypothetical protein
MKSINQYIHKLLILLPVLFFIFPYFTTFDLKQIYLANTNKIILYV